MRTKRTEYVFRRVQAGESYKKIAVDVGVTAERIRQIYKQHTQHDPKEAERIRKETQDLDDFKRIMWNSFRKYRARDASVFESLDLLLNRSKKRVS